MTKKSALLKAFETQKEIEAQAFILGHRLNLRGFREFPVIKNMPFMIEVGAGAAVLFRYGVVVLFGLTAEQKEAFLEQVKEHITNPLEAIETETVIIDCVPKEGDKVSFDAVHLDAWDIDRLLVIADVLAKSQVLSYHETQVSASFDRIEPISLEMQNKGRPNARRTRELVRNIASTLSTERSIAGQVEILDKPDFLWDKPPALQGLFVRLEDEYELRERHGALKEKLDLIYRTSQMMIDLTNSRHTLHVEWYIVILIVIDIAIHIVETYVF